jgi:hypothetical protein
MRIIHILLTVSSLYTAAVVHSDGLLHIAFTNIKSCDSKDFNAFNVTNVVTEPVPIIRGEPFFLMIQGMLSENIERGYIELFLTFGKLKPAKFVLDLCAAVKTFGLNCPIEKGLVTIKYSKYISRTFPPMFFGFKFRFLNEEYNQIACWEGRFQA